jgi:hypothetical protein
MGKPITEGRMIRKSISDSPDFMLLSPEAAVLFCMIIPHLNSHGKLQGGPAFIKEIVCPKIPYLTNENISGLLQEISEKTDMKWFDHDGRHWIHAIHFNEHQKLNMNKIGQDLLPTYSGVTPEQVTHKAKEEVKDKVKEEAKWKSEPEDEKKTAFMNNLKATIEKTKARFPGHREQQEIIVFVQANIRNRNPDAILHCIDSIIKAPGTIKSLPAYLNAALKIEDGKYNAADSERRCNAFKKMGETAVDSLINGIGRGI